MSLSWFVCPHPLLSANFVIVPATGSTSGYGASSTDQQTLQRITKSNEISKKLAQANAPQQAPQKKVVITGISSDPNYKGPKLSAAEEAASAKHHAEVEAKLNAASELARAAQSQAKIAQQLRTSNLDSLPPLEKARLQMEAHQQMMANARTIARGGAPPTEEDKIIEQNQAAVRAQQAIIDAAKQRAIQAAQQASRPPAAPQNGRSGNSEVLDQTRLNVLAHQNQVANHAQIVAAYEAAKKREADAAAAKKAAAGALQP